MNLFIKAAEIWLPDKSGKYLQLGSATYGDLSEFESISRELVFAPGEGLPGETWTRRQPLLWTDLDSDAFKRSQAAQRAGIACGLAMPIMAGEFPLAVVVLFFSAADNVAGAVEIWHNVEHSETELRLVDGFYGAKESQGKAFVQESDIDGLTPLQRFGWISRRLTLLHGRGLPGTAWATDAPVIIPDLSGSGTFVRQRNAKECGITTGLAIPFSNGADGVQIVTLLSAQGTPLTHRFEIWQPNPQRTLLEYGSGYLPGVADASDRYRDMTFRRGDGTAPGEAWLTGRPQLVPLNGRHELVLPQVRNGYLKNMIRMIF